MQTHILVPEGVPHLPHAEGHTSGGTPFLDPLELELRGHRERLKEGESTGLSKNGVAFSFNKGEKPSGITGESCWDLRIFLIALLILNR